VTVIAADGLNLATHGLVALEDSLIQEGSLCAIANQNAREPDTNVNYF